jgi:DNA replication and repair protein RecF
LIGNNGVGKTNILDAIYYLCLTKSYFNSVDQQNILFGKDFMRLAGRFQKPDGAYEIVYKLPLNKRKELLVNEVGVSKLSEHIGNFPCIIISPDDNQLILGNSDERRKFLDATISQINREYLEWLMVYTKILAQRNAALKRFAETRNTDRHLIETYDNQLIPLGNKIYEARQVVVQKLQLLFQTFYKELSLAREPVSFSYTSQLHEQPFAQLLKNNFEKDLLLQRTDAGIHKDDLDFCISNNKMKKFGSQGQQKSFIISMKFAQYKLIKQNKLFMPLLLIDDIFDKLDNDRSRKLIELIAGTEFGQVFLTDTDELHISETLKKNESLFEIIRV